MSDHYGLLIQILLHNNFIFYLVSNRSYWNKLNTAVLYVWCIYFVENINYVPIHIKVLIVIVRINVEYSKFQRVLTLFDLYFIMIRLIAMLKTRFRTRGDMSFLGNIPTWVRFPKLTDPNCNLSLHSRYQYRQQHISRLIALNPNHKKRANHWNFCSRFTVWTWCLSQAVDWFRLQGNKIIFLLPDVLMWCPGILATVWACHLGIFHWVCLTER